MKQDVKQFFGVAACLLASCVWIAGIYKLSQMLGSKDSFWTIFSSVGTMLAAIIALILGGGQLIQNRRDADTRAKLVAARLLPLLARCGDDALALRERLSPDRREYAILDIKSMVFAQARVFNRAAFVAILDDRLAALAPLPDECALRLARAISLLETTVDEILEADRSRCTIEATDEEKQTKLDMWNALLEEGYTLLLTVIKTCQAAAQDSTSDN
ncbi:hypothetical protein BSFA1_68330 (plasmid) [Burkholderia sp. SFA1]|uniref:hypothetical protein n=1 Tax=unclassified Caballeronia TaxID=2646786 RepID=UPI001F37C401|nr:MULTISPECIES: hypothetical protein [unclassified Caballeronia]MCE4546610.1 hypothetical protein [Caballeronia sp. PC1]MCE4572917.1 hypothetical protein [Caballeronia sp. CLC5]BBQ01705.1 hypothetical protein BSFA1_68330 [Burkholderia sp. SFA1]